MQDEEYQAMAVDAVSADQFDRVSGPRGPAFWGQSQVGNTGFGDKDWAACATGCLAHLVAAVE